MFFGKRGGKMIKKIVAMTTITAIFLLTAVSAANLYVDDDKVECPSAGYTNIQDAVDAASAGDTVIVCTGTYNENQINIDKSLILEGDYMLTSIIDGGKAAGLPSTGLVRITANDGDVIFRNFVLKNAGTDAGNIRVGLYASSNTEGVRYNIFNNIIIGSGNPDDEDDYGLYAAGGKENLVFIYNQITQTGANAILIETHPGPTDISYNTLDEGAYGSTAYFSMTYGGLDITTLQKVSHNTIDVGTGNFVYDPLEPWTSGGITFNSASHYSVGSGKYTNVEITDNVITNLIGHRRGISLVNDDTGDGSGGEISSPIITDNTITGELGSTDSRGIQLYGLVSDAEIKGNKISNLDKGFYGTNGKYDDHYATGTTFKNNLLFDNAFGLQWDGIDKFDAKKNWWGSNTGPYHASLNPSGTGDDVSDNVDFIPWLTLDMTLNSPEGKIYDTTRILIDVSVSLKVDKIEYSDNGGAFNTLCTNCDNYSKKKTFNYGDHTLVVRATIGSKTVSKTVEFSVDNKPPRILKQYPLVGKYTNGSFTVVYTEENLKAITLYYKGISELAYKSMTKNDCESGKNKECIFNVDLSSYDGQRIKYYFVVQNDVSEATGRVQVANVDVKIPEITLISPTNAIYNSRKIALTIAVNKEVELEYSDNGHSFRELCNGCDYYNKTHTFSYGVHELQVRATDKADSIVTSSIVFTVKK